jgi:hypothetical protein
MQFTGLRVATSFQPGGPNANHRIASISLALSILEIAIVWGTTAFLYSTGPNASVYRLVSGAWVIGTVLSIVSAVTAILVDRTRKIGLLALSVAVAGFFVCGLPMMV